MSKQDTDWAASLSNEDLAVALETIGTKHDRFTGPQITALQKEAVGRIRKAQASDKSIVS